MGWSNRRAPAPPLGDLDGLEVMCSPCGRGKSIEGAELADLRDRGIEHLDDLRGKLLCKSCGERHQLTLMPVLRRAKFRSDVDRAA